MEYIIDKNTINHLLVKMDIKKNLFITISSTGQFILNAASGKYLKLNEVDYVELILEDNSFFIRKSNSKNGFRVAKHSKLEKYNYRFNNINLLRIIKYKLKIKENKSIKFRLFFDEKTPDKLLFKKI